MDTPNYFFLTFSCVFLLFVTISGLDAVTCGEKKCGVGTTNQCTSNGEDCICLNNFRKRFILRVKEFKVQLCLRPCSNGTCPANYQCSSSSCICVDGFGLSHYTGECAEKCFDEAKCPVNSHCDNTRCICDKGYLRSSDTSGCVEVCSDQQMCPLNSQCDGKLCVCDNGYVRSRDISRCVDVDECEEKPPVCGEHSVCENHPGNYSCQCLEGFILSMGGNSTCLPVIPAASTASKGEISAGIYIGASVGVLVLLAVVVAAIFMRRRRNSNTPPRGTAKHSDEHIAENTPVNDGYETISLENEIRDFPANSRDIKAISVEYLQAKHSKNKSSRKQDAVSVEYSNDQISKKRGQSGELAVSNKPGGQIIRNNQESEGPGVYSAPYDEHVLHNTENKIDGVSRIPYSAPYNKTVKLDDSDAYNTLDALTLNRNNKPENQTKEDLKIKPLKSGDTLNSSDVNAHFTLMPSDVNLTSQPNAENSFDNNHEFNLESDSSSQLQNSNAYYTIESSDPASSDRVHPGGYNKPSGNLDVCSLNTNNSPENQIDQDFKGCRKPLNSVEAAGPKDANTYNTLDSFTLNKTADIKVDDTVVEDGNTYNTLYNVYIDMSGKGEESKVNDDENKDK